MKENNDSGKSHFISKRDNNSINNQKLINKTNEMLLICIKNHLILYLICFCLIIFIYFYSINSIFKTSFLNLRELQENKTYSEIIVIIEGNQDYINIDFIPQPNVENESENKIILKWEQNKKLL